MNDAQMIKDVILATPAPYKSFRFWMVPDNDDIGGRAWLMVLSLKNFSEHTSRQQEIIVEWINVTLTKINGMGIPCGLTRMDDV